MEIKTLAKNTIILASPKILAFSVGILKSKLIAVLLGTTGFGIIEQLTNSINLIRRSTLSFLPDGMVKLIAKERSENFDRNVIGDIIKTYVIMVIPILILVLLLCYIFIDDLTLFVLGDLKYKKYLIISLIALPISFLGVSFRSLLKAFKEVRSFAIAEAYVLVLNLIFFVPLVYYYQVVGGVIYVTLSFIISLVVFFFLVRKNVFKKYGISIKKISKSVFSKIHYNEMLTFIGVGIIGGSFRVFENMASRAIVVNDLGIDKIGVYSPITKWQALFIGFILPSVFTYLYPRLSESKSDEETTMVINDVIRMITFLTLPFIIFGITTREWIIPLFYNETFIEAAIYLPFHFAFLLMTVLGTIFEQIFAPTGRLKIFLVFLIVINSISLFLVYHYVPVYGLYGYLIRFTITPLMTAVSFYLFWRYKIRFRLKKENIIIILYALFTATILIFIRNVNTYYQVLSGVILIISMLLLLKNNEKEFIIKKIKGFIKK